MINLPIERAMSSLTEHQASSVNWGDGALLILAGPGSGKTRILTTRVAKLVAESPESSFRVLALTFTNKAADEMQSRVIELVPEQERRVLIGTFHSFCMQILQQHGSHIGISSDFTIYSQSPDREELLKDAIIEAGLDQNSVQYLSTIDKLKARLILPEGSAKLFKDQHFGAQIEKLYSAYENKLQNLNALDFGSLILRAHELLTKFPGIAKSYQRIYTHWMFDEFQDTTEGQYRLIKAMAGESFRNIFVVADDDQIIYQWNGASYQQIQRFRSDFSPHEIQLPTNYRCPPNIVSAANRLVVHNMERTISKSPLASGKTVLRYPNDQEIHLLRFKSDDMEIEGVAERISNIDVSRRGEVAVLARNRFLLNKLMDSLNARNIETIIAQRRDDFRSPQFLWLSAVLNIAIRPLDKKMVERMIGAFNRWFNLEVDFEEIFNVSEISSRSYISEWNLWVQDSDVKDAIRFAGMAAKFCLQPVSFRSFVKEVIAEFDLSIKESAVENVEVSDLSEDRSAWRALYTNINRAIGRDASLDKFLQELSLRSKEPPMKPNTVTLMTIHAAKGREFDHVYLIGLAEDVLPSYHSLKAGTTSPEMEEERRNCFVAITRASEWLCLSYADSYRGWSKNPSRFLTEMGLPLPSEAISG